MNVKKSLAKLSREAAQIRKNPFMEELDAISEMEESLDANNEIGEKHFDLFGALI